MLACEVRGCRRHEGNTLEKLSSQSEEKAIRLRMVCPSACLCLCLYVCRTASSRNSATESKPLKRFFCRPDGQSTA